MGFNMDRRLFFSVLAAALTLPFSANASANSIRVLKDPNCGCCSDWVEILSKHGFAVDVQNLPNSALVQAKFKAGVPPKMVSCHTAFIDGYVIEGHVPVADIQKLLASKPNAIGMAVPGMPYGSPGMGPENKREAYDVILINNDGSGSVFTSYAAA